LLCCGKCSKWQHIACHDLADRKAGRPKRDWDSEEFVCRTCLVGHNATVNVNGKGKQIQLANGSILLPGPSSSSSSFDAAGGRTPSPYRSYVGQVPSNYTPPPHHSRPSLYRDQQQQQQQSHHSAITFTHYQPQQRGFSIGTHTHQQQQQMPYAQPHYNNTPSSKLAQYHHHHQQVCA
jgi:PHD-finger